MDQLQFDGVCAILIRNQPPFIVKGPPSAKLHRLSFVSWVGFEPAISGVACDQRSDACITSDLSEHLGMTTFVITFE